MVTSLSKGIVPLPSCLGHFPIIFAKYISRKFASFFSLLSKILVTAVQLYGIVSRTETWTAEFQGRVVISQSLLLTCIQSVRKGIQLVLHLDILVMIELVNDKEANRAS